MYDLITIGDSTIDNFIRIHDASVECDVNRESCKICVPYGSKIPVDSIAYGVAGNAANVAVGGSRLGMKTAIYTNLGDDDQGETIKKALIANNVSDSYIEVNDGKKSNLSVVLTFQGERTIFVFHQDWFYKLPKLDGTKWIYLTSMSQSFTNSNIMDEVAHFVDQSKAKLAFGPGTYQLKADIKRFPKILEKCEILILNMEESKKVLGIEQAEVVNPEDVLSKLLLLGPKTVVVTDGEEGSYASDGKTNLKVGVFPTQVVERTGAGDAYSSAVLAGLFHNLPLSEAMVWGTINASHVIQQTGTQLGLMTKNEIERYRKSFTELAATTF